MTYEQAQRTPTPRRAPVRGVAVSVVVWLLAFGTLFTIQVDFGWVDVAVATLVAVLAGVLTHVVQSWLRYAAHGRPSTRFGTTRVMFALAWGSAVGGPIAGIVFMVHTASPGCEGWVGCGTNHPLIGVGVACMVLGLLACAIFGALGYIARSVGEMHAAQLIGFPADRQSQL